MWRKNFKVRSLTFGIIIVIIFGACLVINISGEEIIINKESELNDFHHTNMDGPSVDNWFIVDTVGWWHFDEGAGSVTEDSSSYGNHGSCVKTQWTTGPDGSSALLFTAAYNSYVKVNDDPSLDFDDLGEDEGFMIEFWMQKGLTPTHHYSGLVAKVYSDGGYSTRLTRSNLIGFLIHHGVPGDYEELYSETAITDTDQWHHIVFVWCEETMYIYIDDMTKPDAMKFIGEYPIGNTYKWLDVGNDWPTDAENPFDGKIDELRISIVKPIRQLKTTLIFGKITNLNAEGEFITFEAVNIRCIQFLPFAYVPYTSGEQIIILKEKLGIITVEFIYALCKADIWQ